MRSGHKVETRAALCRSIDFCSFGSFRPFRSALSPSEFTCSFPTDHLELRLLSLVSWSWKPMWVRSELCKLQHFPCFLRKGCFIARWPYHFIFTSSGPVIYICIVIIYLHLYTSMIPFDPAYNFQCTFMAACSFSFPLQRFFAMNLFV